MRIEERSIPWKGHTFTLRTAEETDAETLLSFLKQVSGETEYLIRGEDEVNLTLQQEKQFIAGVNDSLDSLMLMGFLDGVYVGNCSINGYGFYRMRHRAEVAVALFQKYTGMGLGTLMLENIIDVAKRMGLEQLELEVVSTNEKAIALYMKMGFEVQGNVVHGMKYKDGTYADLIMMRKDLIEKKGKVVFNLHTVKAKRWWLSQYLSHFSFARTSFLTTLLLSRRDHHQFFSHYR